MKIRFTSVNTFVDKVSLAPCCINRVNGLKLIVKNRLIAN